MAKQTIDELAVIISANASKLPTDLNKAKKEFDKFAKDVQDAHPPPPKPPDMRAHQRAAREAASLRSQVRETGESILGFATKVAATGGTLVAFELGLGGVTGAFDQLKQSVRSAADFEQTSLSFEVMLGSARRAQRMLGEIRQYAATTPFNTREITGAARQLVAYGFAAEQVMPTVKMLGDVSAGMGDAAPMGDLTYLYGTLRSQGRAYTRDMLQFTNRGIPVWEGLIEVMGKSRAELQGMVEDGRIGFADIEEVFRRMTGEGGKFYQMTARQGQTVAGVLEQMKDSFDLFKLELGKVLIEELGLKDAARDLDNFAKNLRDNVGEVRPAVREFGQMARAVAQVGYEFGRASLLVARLNIESYADAFPGLKEAAGTLRKMLDDAKNFKLDEKEVIRFAFSFGRSLSVAAEQAGNRIADFGEGLVGLVELIVRGARQAEQAIENAARWLNEINNKASDAGKFLTSPLMNPLAGVVGLALRDDAAAPLRGRQPGDPIPVGAIPAPVPGMSADRIRAEYAALSAEVRAAEAALTQARRTWQDSPIRNSPSAMRPLLAAEARVDAAHRNRGTWVHGGFEGNPVELTRHLDSGNVPTIRGAAGPAAPPAPSALDAGLAAAKEFFKGFRRDGGDIRAALDERERDLLATVDARRAAEAARNAATEARRLVMVAGVGPAGLFPSPVDTDAQNRQAARAAALGPIATLPPRPPVRAEVGELALELRREYDPRPELNVLRRQLDEISSRQMLGPNTDALVERAWRDRLGQAAGKLGIDQGRYQLPEATAVGSAEDARIINAWRTEGQRPTSEQIWQRIATAVETLVRIEEERATRLPVAPLPRVVQLPGE